jgi:hypothetical protein
MGFPLSFSGACRSYFIGLLQTAQYDALEHA